MYFVAEFSDLYDVSTEGVVLHVHDQPGIRVSPVLATHYRTETVKDTLSS